MSATQQFIIEVLKQGKEYFEILLTAVAAWHAPQPRYMRKKVISKEEG